MKLNTFLENWLSCINCSFASARSCMGYSYCLHPSIPKEERWKKPLNPKGTEEELVERNKKCPKEN